MSDIRDYIRWRGDLRFSQVPLNSVDTLVFAELCYIHFDDLLDDPDTPRELMDAAEEFFTREDCEELVRSKYDLELLELAAKSVRFGQTEICWYRDKLIPEQETQFAAMTFLMDDGTALVTFRGTDSSVIGWKEDFNMSFQQSVPSQRMAQDYVREVGLRYGGPISICGHSKGGNMAVFSAARSSPMLQSRIRAVYNHDGPGFSEYMMGDPGYMAMVPKIHTFVPQSSVIGMLMDHEEPYTIIKSKQIGVLQHDAYNWEVMGPGFIRMEEITADSRFLNETIRTWAAGLSNQERNAIVDAVFGILEEGNVEKSDEIFHPRNLRNYLKILSADEQLRKLVGGGLTNFLEAARVTAAEVAQQRELEEEQKKPGFFKKLSETTRQQAELLKQQRKLQSEGRKNGKLPE